jgi:uncharacterized protein YndB with AHSA1/START domain
MPEILPDPITCSVLIRATPMRAYDAFATGQGLDEWFTQGAMVEARPGGTIRFRWVEWGPDRYTGEDGGPVLEAEPGKRLVFQWHPDGPGYATTVQIDFEPHEVGTLVRLRDDGYRDSPSGRKAQLNCAAGWGEALALAKFWLEHGVRY